MTEMQVVRLGIVGLGAMGSQHAIWLRDRMVDGIQLCAVADPGPQAQTFAKDHLPNISLFQSPETMMKSGLIDAVLLCSPHHLHAPQSMFALQNGLHVLTEKPVGLHAADVRENQIVAEQKKLRYALAFNQRHNPLNRRIHDAIHNNDIGHIHRALYIATDCYRTKGYYHSAAWRATWSMEGGGMLMNQNAHALDQILWWLGMPVAVTAHLGFGKYHTTIAVEDEVNVFMTFPDGSTCNLITSTGDYPGSSALELHGDCGKLFVQDGQLIWDSLDTSCSEFSENYQGGFGHPKVKRMNITPAEKDKQHIDILQNFADSILHGTPLTAVANDGLRALELAHAIYCSAWLDSTVKLPVDDNVFEKEWLSRAKIEKQRQVTSVSLDLQNVWKK